MIAFCSEQGQHNGVRWPSADEGPFERPRLSSGQLAALHPARGAEPYHRTHSAGQPSLEIFSSVGFYFLNSV